MKVYCDDCKYDSGIEHEHCNKKINYQSNYRSKNGAWSYPNQQKINKDNKCPYYKRKWWKFWIKDISKLEKILYEN